MWSGAPRFEYTTDFDAHRTILASVKASRADGDGRSSVARTPPAAALTVRAPLQGRRRVGHGPQLCVGPTHLLPYVLVLSEAYRNKYDTIPAHDLVGLLRAALFEQWMP